MVPARSPYRRQSSTDRRPTGSRRHRRSARYWPSDCNLARRGDRLTERNGFECGVVMREFGQCERAVLRGRQTVDEKITLCIVAAVRTDYERRVRIELRIAPVLTRAAMVDDDRRAVLELPAIAMSFPLGLKAQPPGTPGVLIATSGAEPPCAYSSTCSACVSTIQTSPRESAHSLAAARSC